MNHITGTPNLTFSNEAKVLAPILPERFDGVSVPSGTAAITAIGLEDSAISPSVCEPEPECV